MIFVTLGSQKFPFDRLLQELDRLIEAGVIAEPVFAQTGYCTYAPKQFPFEPFLDRDTFAAKLQDLFVKLPCFGAVGHKIELNDRPVNIPVNIH